ncbi:MAG: hypothetical protein AB7O39_01010 [Flavobacteriaceae bacterium]
MEARKAETERLFRVARAEHAAASDPQGFLDAIAGGNDETLAGLGEDERQGLTEQAEARLDAQRREAGAQRVADIARQSRELLAQIASGDPAVTAHAITASGLSASDTQKLHRAYEAKQAENAQVDDVFRRLNEGSAFNPKDTNERLAVSKAYAAAAKDGDLFGEDPSARDTALFMAGSTGIVPDTVLSSLRGAFASDDPARIAAAATLAADLNETSPEALADAGAGTIADIGTEYTRLTAEMGFSPEQAVGKAMSCLRDAAEAVGGLANLFLPTPANAAVPSADGEFEVPQGSVGMRAPGGSPATGQFSPNAGDAAPESAKPEAEIQLARMMRAPAGARRTAAGRSSPTTLRQEAELEALRPQRDKKVALVREHRPNWKPPAGLYEGPEGQIDQLRDEIESANRALADISRRSGPTSDPKIQESLHTNDPVDRIYSGESEDPDGLKDMILSAPSPEDENHWTEAGTETLNDGGRRTRYVGRQGAVVEETLRRNHDVTSRLVTLPDGVKFQVDTQGLTQRIWDSGGRLVSALELTPSGFQPAGPGRTLTDEEEEQLSEALTTLYNNLVVRAARSGKNGGKQVALGGRIREYRETGKGPSLSVQFVGELAPSDVKQRCKLLPEIQKELDDAEVKVRTDLGTALLTTSPQVFGTLVHNEAAAALRVKFQGLYGTKIFIEQSFDGSFDANGNPIPVDKRAKGHLYFDVIEVTDDTLCIYDHKTGDATLTKSRADDLAYFVVKYGGFGRMPLLIPLKPFEVW